jgi:hypothetical protein
MGKAPAKVIRISGAMWRLRARRVNIGARRIALHATSDYIISNAK